MTINTSLFSEKDPDLAWEVGTGRWQLAGKGEVGKAGPEMGWEVWSLWMGWLKTHTVSGGGCWLNGCAGELSTHMQPVQLGIVLNSLSVSCSENRAQANTKITNSH